MSQLTMDKLKQIMREGAGEDESISLDGDILDTAFADLGYDSLALLETVSRIGREFGVELDDEVVSEVETPRELIDLVNKSSVHVN
jgi:act minimal PKS acyl carrier protein